MPDVFDCFQNNLLPLICPLTVIARSDRLSLFTHWSALCLVQVVHFQKASSWPPNRPGRRGINTPNLHTHDLLARIISSHFVWSWKSAAIVDIILPHRWLNPVRVLPARGGNIICQSLLVDAGMKKNKLRSKLQKKQQKKNLSRVKLLAFGTTWASDQKMGAGLTLC